MTPSPVSARSQRDVYAESLIVQPQFNSSLPAVVLTSLDDLQQAMLNRNDSLHTIERTQVWRSVQSPSPLSAAFTPGDSIDISTSDPIAFFTSELAQQAQQSNTFTVNLSFLVPSQRIDILAAPSTVILFGWSQYVPLALLVWWFLSQFRNFLFRNQLIGTVIKRDTTPITKQHQF